jgi:transcriptional regulator with XRE-family HTH domain
MALGANVKRLREAAGLTQTQLAELAHMDQQAVAALEKRDSKSSSFALALAHALGVSIDDLLGTGQPKTLRIVETPASTEMSTMEVLQLIDLYGHSTKTGRDQIMRMARSAEKNPDSGSLIAADNQS